MATITTTGVGFTAGLESIRTSWWSSSPLLNDTGGTLSGSFVAANRAIVWLIHKPSKQLIATTMCDASGNFSFTGLDRSVDDYLVVTANEPGAAMTFDRVTPV